jgi:hypothetical protein
MIVNTIFPSISRHVNKTNLEETARINFPDRNFPKHRSVQRPPISHRHKKITQKTKRFNILDYLTELQNVIP